MPHGTLTIPFSSFCRFPATKLDPPQATSLLHASLQLVPDAARRDWQGSKRPGTVGVLTLWTHRALHTPHRPPDPHQYERTGWTRHAVTGKFEPFHVDVRSKDASRPGRGDGEGPGPPERCLTLLVPRWTKVPIDVPQPMVFGLLSWSEPMNFVELQFFLPRPSDPSLSRMQQQQLLSSKVML